MGLGVDKNGNLRVTYLENDKGVHLREKSFAEKQKATPQAFTSSHFDPKTGHKVHTTWKKGESIDPDFMQAALSEKNPVLIDQIVGADPGNREQIEYQQAKAMQEVMDKIIEKRWEESDYLAFAANVGVGASMFVRGGADAEVRNMDTETESFPVFFHMTHELQRRLREGEITGDEYLSKLNKMYQDGAEELRGRTDQPFGADQTLGYVFEKVKEYGASLKQRW